MSVIVRGWPWCEASGKLYFGGMHHIRYADRSTFDVLSKWWARDSKNVYSAGSVIRDADVESFTVLNELYAKDANRAYTMMGPIKGADVSTFTSIGDTKHPCSTYKRYAKDSQAVYHTTKGGKACLMKAADPATFTPLSHGYGCDSKHVFCERTKLPGAKPDEWEFIRGHHSRSAERAFLWNKRIKGARGNSLRSLPMIDFLDIWCRDDKSFFNRTSPANPQDYFLDFLNCFIFVGKVDHVELKCTQDDKEVSVDEPDAWMLAGHAWIYVTPSKWLQKPSMDGVPTPKIGKPVRFGQGMYLDSLTEGNWMDEDRIWMLQAHQDSSHVEPHCFFSCVNVWWEYLHLSELGFITDLIVEAQHT